MGRRVGMNRYTGKVLVGWPHVSQSISTIMVTELGSRVQRRDLGSMVPGMLDKPQNEENILRFYMAVAVALEPRQMRHSTYGEPDFKLLLLGLDASVPGQVSSSAVGIYYEDGRQVGGRRNIRVALPVV